MAVAGGGGCINFSVSQTQLFFCNQMVHANACRLYLSNKYLAKIVSPRFINLSPDDNI